MPKTKFTVTEYLALDRLAAVRSDFFEGEMFEMPRVSREHCRVNDNLCGEVGLQLKGTPYETFSHTLRVLVEQTGFFCYPDLMIVGDVLRFAAVDRDTLVNPRVVFEVLSPSTERYDRTTKFLHYKQLPSVEEYVLVAQDRAWCERYVRQPDGVWGHVEFVGLDATLELKAVPVAVPLADVYARVEFLPPEPPPPGGVRP